MPPIEKSMIQDRTDAWWHRELMRMSAITLQWLGWRYPSIRHLHQDLAAEMTAQLTEYLLSHPDTVPISWYGSTEPPIDDAQRFRALVFTVLSRRTQDHFRAEFRRWVEVIPLHELDDAGFASDNNHIGKDTGDDIDARRYVVALLKLLTDLPDADRQLMEQIALGGADRPLDVAERKRVSRLRQRLKRELRDRLGPSSDDLLAKI
jgi:hypothetical protein